MAINQIIDEMLLRLAGLRPEHHLVVTLYLNTQPDQHGRAHFEPFVRKEFAAIEKTLPKRGSERESLDRDFERIETFLQKELRPSTNGLVVFACAGANDFFETLQLEAPMPWNRLYVAPEPHVYTLSLLGDKYVRHAILVADTQRARLFVVGLYGPVEKGDIQRPGISRSLPGGWSQARYQRRVRNDYRRHAKEFIEALDTVVREEGIAGIILAGDEVIVPKLKEQMPRHLADKVLDILHLDIRTPEHQIHARALEVLGQQETVEDKQKVEQLLLEYRAGGLAVVGREETLAALENGQVDEVILSTSLKANYPEGAESLVRRARETDAEITFIQDASLLEEIGGAGALLRYRIDRGMTRSITP